MGIIICIIAALLAELTFAISFIPIYFIVKSLHFVYALLNVRNKYRWISDGILSGGSCIFLTCYVVLLITKNQALSEVEIILLAIALPLACEVAYYRNLVSGSVVPIWGRLNLAAKNPAQRGEFAANLYTLEQEYLLNHSEEDLKAEQTTKLLRQKAYDQTQGALFYLFLWSVVGYIAGLVLFHHCFF